MIQRPSHSRGRTSGADRTIRRAPRNVDATNWAGVREEYVTGSDTIAQLATRLGIPVRTLEWHAAGGQDDSGPTWAQLRSAFREDVARRFRSAAIIRATEAALSIHDNQVRAAAALVDAALPVALAALTSGDVRGFDAVKAALAALAAQRKVHGLDRVDARLEVTGRGGGRIEHDVDFSSGALDPSLAVLAESALAIVFGNAQGEGMT